MPGDLCVVCGNYRKHNPQLSFHRFPSDLAKRSLWVRVFELDPEAVKPHHRVCSRHFFNGDPKNGPQPHIGRRFASPVKKGSDRSARAIERQQVRKLQELQSASTKSYGSGYSSSSSASTNTSSFPQLSTGDDGESTTNEPELMTVSVGEQLIDNYQVTELPDDGSTTATSSSQQHLVETALLARIEFLEAQLGKLQNNDKSTDHKKSQPFSIDQIKHDDHQVSFYTGFPSFAVFLEFYQCLGPAVDKLHYWGTKPDARKQHRSTKLTPMDQLFMTLVKLRLDLKFADLAFRFNISTGLVSRYFNTWICFLYHHLKEIDWMPSIKQVEGTLPSAFREKYPSTYCILDGSEIFMETPSDLHMQSSTWSNYKHHNTVKFLIGCTPNGCISFISPLYVGSISDVELTRVSGLLTHLKDKPGISVMADRGFTIKDILNDIGVKLNILPFMDGRKQLPAVEISEGRKIASVRIHVERAIGRMKSFSILKHIIPITLAGLSNHIVCVCAFLSNFKPVLVPPHESTTIHDEDSYSDVEEYFAELSDDEQELSDEQELGDSDEEQVI